ncbi:MAG: DUF6868 family protein [Gammaproteobacteria bacterium]
MEINTVASFLGWCSIINIGILFLSTAVVLLMRETISNIHSTMFGVSESNLPSAYFRYLANYKIAILVFNIAPYFALQIMS